MLKLSKKFSLLLVSILALVTSACQLEPLPDAPPAKEVDPYVPETPEDIDKSRRAIWGDEPTVIEGITNFKFIGDHVYYSGDITSYTWSSDESKVYFLTAAPKKRIVAYTIASDTYTYLTPGKYSVSSFKFYKEQNYILFDSDKKIYSLNLINNSVSKVSTHALSLNYPKYELVKYNNNQLSVLYNSDDASHIGLYSVSLDGTNETLLTPVMPATATVNYFSYNSASNKIIYAADSNVDLRNEIFTMDTDGSNHVRINDNLVSGGSLVCWNSSHCGNVTSDGLKIVYAGDAQTDNKIELYVANIDSSGSPIKLNQALPATSSVSSTVFKITSDDARVLYTADVDYDNAFELYIVNMDGTGRIKLNPNLPDANRDVISYELWTDPSDNTQRVIFLADIEQDNFFEFYKVDLDGNNLTKVVSRIDINGSIDSYKILGDQNTVLLVTDLNDSGQKELWQGHLNGTGIKKLFSTTHTQSSIEIINFTQDTNKIYFKSDAYVDGVQEVFLAQRDLNQVNTLGVNIGTILFNEAYSKALFLSNLYFTSSQELYYQDLSQPYPKKISLAMAHSYDKPNDNITFGVDPSSQYAVYMASNDQLEEVNLISTKLDGSGQKQLNDPLMSGGCIDAFKFIGGGNPYVAYFGDGLSSLWNEVHSVKLDGTDNRKLNGYIMGNDGVDYYNFFQDNTILLYTADEDDLNNEHTYKIDFNNNFEKTYIGPHRPDYDVFTLLPNGNTVVYLDMFNQYIRKVSADGLNSYANLVTTDSFYDSLLGPIVASPDSQRVAYSYHDDSDNDTMHLYSIKVDGTGKVKLTTTAPSTADGVKEFVFSHDSTKIVYQWLDSKQIYADNSAGGAKVQIAADSVEFSITQSGTNKVVYNRVDGGVYVSELDGSNNNLLSSPGAIVSNFKLVNDTRVVYMANEDDPNLFEIYAINTDGTNKVKLSGTIISGGSVESYALSSDKNFIVYLAFQDDVNVGELYKVNIDGSGRKKIHENLSAPYFIGSYEITKDNQGVVVSANRINRKRLGLFYLDLDWSP